MRRTGHASELGKMVPVDKVAETLWMVKCGMLRRRVYRVGIPGGTKASKSYWHSLQVDVC